MNNISKLMIGFSLVSTIISGKEAIEGETLPNIVIILADDLGYGDIGCYGAEDIKTPNLDKLAAQGVRFTNFYSNGPECTPTRAALLTGRYQQRVGGLECAIGLGNIGRYKEALALSDRGELGLPVEFNTLPSMLKKKGYQTALIGKWHLGDGEKYSPKAHGFDYSIGLLGGAVDYFHHTEPKGVFLGTYMDGEHDFYRNGQPHQREGYYMTHLITDESVEWINIQKKEQPFFLYIPYTAPHDPYQGPDGYSPEIMTTERWGVAGGKVYAEMIEELDKGIGKILDKLDDKGFANNTLFIFFSDNGPTKKGSAGPFSGNKGGVFEGGIRVPCTITWPGKIEPGTVSDQMAISMDITASIAKIIGTDPLKSLDGIDLIGHVANKRKNYQRTLYWRKLRGETVFKAVRDGNLKYIRNINGDESEEYLFDLAADQAEKNNIKDTKKKEFSRLKKMIEEWEDEVQPERYSQSAHIQNKDNRFDWLQTARVFLLDAYQPPFAPELEYDAEAWAETMADMNVNVLRFPTMGKYATIQGVRFSTHPDQGNRDLLQETIDACKPKGIKVVPYISTGHKLAWSMVTKDYPEYGQKTIPGGQPARSHMFVGEDHGTVCWMTPYRKAFMDLVEHVVRDYDIDGMYFDKWEPHYFWPGKKLCYCEGCRTGFRESTGLEIPYQKDEEGYSPEELKTIGKYHNWYKEEYMTEVVQKVRELVRSYKDIPLISNINNPERMADQDTRILNNMDAFLYERGHSMLERAEGVGVPRSVGLNIWPYIGVYHNWPRLAFQGINCQQEIFTNLMFGGGSIIAQPTGYIGHTENREYARYPFGIIKKHEKVLEGLKNRPYVGVVFACKSPKGHVQSGWLSGTTNARTSTLGAFSACLYNHIQVSSISEFVLDDPAKLKEYPILYLANIPFLSEERVNNITGYVYNGGCLIASYATTLFNAAGKRQPRFDLEDLFKVRPISPQEELAEIINSYQAMVGGPNDLYLLAIEGNKEIFDGKREDRLFPLWYYEPVEVLDGGKILMDIVTGHDRLPILPGVVLSNYGNGRVIYCASGMESLFNLEGPDMTGELIQEFVKAVSNKPAPYSLNAPAGLLANLTEKENIMVLHLTNWTGNKFEKPWWNEFYLAPVENVRLQIRIPDGIKVKSVSTLVEAMYDQRITDQNLEIFLPKVEAYQGIVVRLEQ